MAAGFSQRFGSVYVDDETQKRTSKNSYYRYRDLTRRSSRIRIRPRTLEGNSGKPSTLSIACWPASLVFVLSHRAAMVRMRDNGEQWEW